MLLGACAASAAAWLGTRRWTAFVFVSLSCASHGLLDMLTNGGHGIALLWPFREERYFLPWQVIEVSTLNLRRFFGPAGLAVLASELHWVWLPALAVAVACVLGRRILGKGHRGGW